MDTFCSHLLHDVITSIPGAIAGCILHQNQLDPVLHDILTVLGSMLTADREMNIINLFILALFCALN